MPEEKVIAIKSSITAWLNTDEGSRLVDQLMPAYFLGIPRGVVTTFVITSIAVDFV